LSNDLLMTGWAGFEFGMIAAHTMPLMAAYAERHGMKLYAANLAGARPPSWMKVPALIGALEKFDRVVWIDADVVISRHDDNIFDEVSEFSVQAVVPHETPCGTVPNCGVWVVKPEMRETLTAAWMCERHINHYWWEQAAMLELMGYSVVADEQGLPRCLPGTPTGLRSKTEWLSPKWNHHPQDERRVGSPNFIHVTGYADRLGAIKQLCHAVST